MLKLPSFELHFNRVLFCLPLLLLALSSSFVFQGCSEPNEIIGVTAAEDSVDPCGYPNVGSVACPCLGGQLCEIGLFCENGNCREPKICQPPRDKDCGCDAQNHCGAGLECVSGICKYCGADPRGCSCDVSSDCGIGNLECVDKLCGCGIGFKGPECQFDNETTCSGNGSVSEVGTCSCSGNWGGDACDRCVSGYAGDRCEYSDYLTCYNRGTVDGNGVCACKAGWVGDQCTECEQYSFGSACATTCPGFNDDNVCNGQGTCNDGISGDGTCDCDPEWMDPGCTSCATGYVSKLGSLSVCCKIGSANCSCASGGACDDGTMCVGNICVEPPCLMGEEGCVCRQSSDAVSACDIKVNAGLAEPMQCYSGVCRTRTCKPGAKGCVCIGGDNSDDGVCDNSTCLDGYCGGLVENNNWAISGGFGEECRVHSEDVPVADICDWGFRCDREPGQSGNEAGVCSPCDPGTQSCQCRVPTSDAVMECEQGLTCVADGFGGRCEHSQWASGNPCFSYCGNDLVGAATDAFGNYVNCEDGVVPACVYTGKADQCEYGGCYNLDDVNDENWRLCEIDPDCPDFQRCLFEPSLRKKICASTCGPAMPWACDEHSQCLKGVCRQECTVDNDVPCENSNEECRQVKSSDPGNLLGHCFANNPVQYEAYGSAGIATFAITSDEDEGALRCTRANGQEEVGAEDCGNSSRGDECGSSTPSSTCEYLKPKEVLNAPFSEVYNSNPTTFRASFRVKNTGPWMQTFFITKSREMLPTNDGAMITRTVPSPHSYLNRGAACIPGSLGCVPDSDPRNEECRPWSDSTYIDGGANCKTDAECGSESGLECNEVTQLCERPPGVGCTNDNQCGDQPGAKCLDTLCRRVLNTTLNTDTNRCELEETQMLLEEAAGSSEKAGVLLPFLGVRLNEESAQYNAVHEMEIEPGDFGIVWLDFERDTSCADVESSECLWKG